MILSLCLQAPLHEALREMPNGSWSYYIRDGIAAILHSRVGTLNHLSFVPSEILLLFPFFFPSQVKIRRIIPFFLPFIHGFLQKCLIY